MNISQIEGMTCIYMIHCNVHSVDLIFPVSVAAQNFSLEASGGYSTLACMLDEDQFAKIKGILENAGIPFKANETKLQITIEGISGLSLHLFAN